ncbi:MBOAT family O-acyltransferase [Pontibacter sp. BAB1700]|uniref:MBOAT family O-acyltransferase n=1 Tax=Pontibacter sp. BAB1700 TaxID=1144253 RepID=UPI0002FAB8AC|nr:MBOAT family O-acyltransferase [Pontibacter sp. BAB1700]
MIADNLALMVNQVYNNPTDYEGVTLIIATVFFAFQIYCDFSGYSDIAIGAAQVMGFRLMENFRRPYYSKSISEFWSRWHISLSSWFRDYLYIPLGGNRVVKWRWYYNLFITFLVSGLWHGANWTFVVWVPCTAFTWCLLS